MPDKGIEKRAVRRDGEPEKPQSLREWPAFFWKQSRKFFSRLFYIYGLVWETKPWILFAMLFMAVFKGVTPIIGAVIAKDLINALIETAGGGGTFSVVSGLLVLQFIYLFATRIENRVNHFVMRLASELVVNHIRCKIMDKAKEVDIESFDRPEFYEKLENANREAGRRPIDIMNSTFTVMSNVISMASFIVVLCAVSTLAPLLIIAVSIPSAVINFIYRRKNVLYMRNKSKSRRQMNYYSGLMVNKDVVKEIRLFGLSDHFIRRFKEVFGQYFAGIRRLIWQEGAWNVAFIILNTAVNCGLFLWIAYQVWNGVLTVGDYTLYTGALNNIANGVNTLITTTATIYEGTLFIDNMISFMNEPKTIVPTLEEPRHVQHGEHRIEFCHVSFRYPGTGRDVLKDVSFSISSGDSVVLVGLNGAGKTTLLKLLMRLYDPTGGKILLDGQDLREYDVQELYHMFGSIFQDFGKYAVSVRENIRFGDLSRDPGEHAVEDAAEQANADFIGRLPDGFDTPLMRIFEENGIELSIGQWQKLAIARAFYSDSDVLILDEPTASLDPMAEQEIFSQFDRLRRGKMTIFVSHRLSSATTATKILVMEQGQLIEQGTHAELMKQHGKYYTLFSVQAKHYIESEEPEENLTALPEALKAQ